MTARIFSVQRFSNSEVGEGLRGSYFSITDASVALLVKNVCNMSILCDKINATCDTLLLHLGSIYEMVVLII